MGKSVIFVNSVDFSRPSAFQFRLLAIARGLIEAGIDVKWYLLNSPVEKLIADNANYREISFLSFRSSNPIMVRCKLLKFLHNVYILATLESRLDLENGDSTALSCFATGLNAPLLMVLSRICKRQDIKLIHEVTEYPLLYFRSSIQKINAKLYFNYFLPKCDHVFVISSALKFFYENRLRTSISYSRVSILNMMVEFDQFYKPELKIDKFSKDIVYTGSMYGDKDGVYYLIEAFSLIMDKYADSRLVLVGDITNKAKMQKVLSAINNLSDPSRVVIMGQMPRSKVIEIVNRAYCLALARPDNIQATYGFPTKLGEYLATGNPVVVTAVGDIPKFLRDEENAFIAIPDNIVSFADRLSTCLDDPSFAYRVGRNGQLLAKGIFNYHQAVKPLLETLK